MTPMNWSVDRLANLLKTKAMASVIKYSIVISWPFRQWLLCTAIPHWMFATWSRSIEAAPLSPLVNRLANSISKFSYTCWFYWRLASKYSENSTNRSTKLAPVKTERLSLLAKTSTDSNLSWRSILNFELSLSILLLKFGSKSDVTSRNV